MIAGSHFVKGSGVERAVAEEFIDRPMKLVRARASHDVDLPAAGPAHFSGITSGLYLEFQHCVRRGAQVESIECRIGIGRAVEKKIVRVRPVSTDTDRRTLSGPPIKRIHITRRGAMTGMRAKYGEHEIDQHAPVER